MHRILLLHICFLFSLTLHAQHVANIKVIQEVDKVIITYDITSDKAGQTFNIKVECSSDNGKTFSILPENLTGDVKEVRAGSAKRIEWDVLSEREELTGDHFVFQLVATDSDKQKSIEFDIKIGDTYQGGKIACIFQPGNSGYIAGETHGIIVAPKSIPFGEGIMWCNRRYTKTGATDSGTGNVNTDKIVKTQGNGNYAAYLCFNLRFKGFKDWYLPSREELGILFLNRKLIGDFIRSDYWSSTEENAESAWYQDFYDGKVNSKDKEETLMIRAIRKF